MPLGMFWILCEGYRWFKPPKLSSRECQCCFQMLVLIKANKKCFFLLKKNPKQKALWFPGFANSIWHHQGLQLKQLLKHLWTKVSHLPGKAACLSSSVEKKCKYLCWKQKDERADPLLTVPLYKEMRERELLFPACCASDCWGAVLAKPSHALGLWGAAWVLCFLSLVWPTLPLHRAGSPPPFTALPVSYQCCALSEQEDGFSSIQKNPVFWQVWFSWSKTPQWDLDG